MRTFCFDVSHTPDLVYEIFLFLLSFFYIFFSQSAKTLDTEMLKSRARLGKQGALAQRRKPKRPSQDPSKRQTWMFGDPNGTILHTAIDEKFTKQICIAV